MSPSIHIVTVYAWPTTTPSSATYIFAIIMCAAIHRRQDTVEVVLLTGRNLSIRFFFCTLESKKNIFVLTLPWCLLHRINRRFGCCCCCSSNERKQWDSVSRAECIDTSCVSVFIHIIIHFIGNKMLNENFLKINFLCATSKNLLNENNSHSFLRTKQDLLNTECAASDWIFVCP